MLKIGVFITIHHWVFKQRASIVLDSAMSLTYNLESVNRCLDSIGVCPSAWMLAKASNLLVITIEQTIPFLSGCHRMFSLCLLSCTNQFAESRLLCSLPGHVFPALFGAGNTRPCLTQCDLVLHEHPNLSLLKVEGW